MKPMWRDVPNDPDTIDNLLAHGASVRIERMSDTEYWVGLTVDGKEYNLDFYISQQGKLIAFNRGDLPETASKEQP